MALRKPRPSSMIIDNSPTRGSRPESPSFSPNHKRSESEKPNLHKRRTISTSHDHYNHEKNGLLRTPTLPLNFTDGNVSSRRHAIMDRPLPPVPPNTATLQIDGPFVVQSKAAQPLRISPTPSMVHLPIPSYRQSQTVPFKSEADYADHSFLSLAASPTESPVKMYSEMDRRPVNTSVQTQSIRQHTTSTSSFEKEREMAMEKYSRSTPSNKAVGYSSTSELLDDPELDWRYIIDNFLEDDLPNLSL
ncbi:unnamed protein product [Somion occarium]|uniref:Uncharacterized protein n=1 Tax=Somion occarium TaxID=3059160 RepID=A0ABP1E7D5_9APHY